MILTRFGVWGRDMRVRRGFAGDGSSRMVGIAVKGREIAERIEREAEAEITKKEEEG